MMRSPINLTCHARSCRNGGSASLRNACLALRIGHGGDARRLFPPLVQAEIKALACQIPKETGVPLSRFSSQDIAVEAVTRGIVASISGITIWRWLKEDAIRPWNHRMWIFPRDPDFQEKAERVLDLYHKTWQGRKLGPDEYVVSADEKTSIQARGRKHAVLPPQSGKAMRVEHEYERNGALAYLAAWDVHRARIFGRCE